MCQNWLGQYQILTKISGVSGQANVSKNWLDNNSLSINFEKTKCIHLRIKIKSLSDKHKIMVHLQNCFSRNNPNIV